MTVIWLVRKGLELHGTKTVNIRHPNVQKQCYPNILPILRALYTHKGKGYVGYRVSALSHLRQGSRVKVASMTGHAARRSDARLVFEIEPYSEIF